MPVENKNILVTGAAKRLGRAIVLDLAAHGFNIAIHYRSAQAEAEATAAEAKRLGARVALLKADLAEEVETISLVGRAKAALGALSGLVNNASRFEHDHWNSTTRESWDRHMEINLRAPFVLMQSFARQLPEGGQGAIVNLIDQRMLKPTPEFMSYSLSKAGLRWLTVTMAQALAPTVRVNAVAPGPTLINPRQTQEDFDRQCQATVLGRGAAPQDVCDAVRYLLTAASVTGQMIATDGGQHLIWQTPDTEARE
jgi:NAD(P)-dependent dehydrogenase (short-subunit alcohol dehydrogenase family)